MTSEFSCFSQTQPACFKCRIQRKKAAVCEVWTRRQTSDSISYFKFSVSVSASTQSRSVHNQLLGFLQRGRRRLAERLKQLNSEFLLWRFVKSLTVWTFRNCWSECIFYFLSVVVPVSSDVISPINIYFKPGRKNIFVCQMMKEGFVLLRVSEILRTNIER